MHPQVDAVPAESDLVLDAFDHTMAGQWVSGEPIEEQSGRPARLQRNPAAIPRSHGRESGATTGVALLAKQELPTRSGQVGEPPGVGEVSLHVAPILQLCSHEKPIRSVDERCRHERRGPPSGRLSHTDVIRTAIPWPTPMHIVASARCAPRLRISKMAVPVMRAPDMPVG